MTIAVDNLTLKEVGALLTLAAKNKGVPVSLAVYSFGGCSLGVELDLTLSQAIAKLVALATPRNAESVEIPDSLAKVFEAALKAA